MLLDRDKIVFRCREPTIDRIVFIVQSLCVLMLRANKWQSVKTTVKKKRGEAATRVVALFRTRRDVYRVLLFVHKHSMKIISVNFHLYQRYTREQGKSEYSHKFARIIEEMSFVAVRCAAFAVIFAL